MKNKEKLKKTRKRDKKESTVVIELNMSLTIGVIIGIILLIVTIMTAKIITTLVQTSESKKVANVNEENERVSYVTSTTKDDNGNIVSETDSEGNVVKVPVPKGYSASQIDGETTASKGFVIYEGDVDWSSILVNTQSTESTKTTESTETTESLSMKSRESTANTKTTEMTGTTERTDTQETSVEKESTTESTEQQESIQTVKENLLSENTKSISEEIVRNENTQQTQENNITNSTENDEEITSLEDETTGETQLTSEEQQAKNIFELQKIRNQYVWVPVSDISRIYGVDSDEKLWGKLYNFSSTGRTNRNWNELEGIISITNKTNYREPDVVWSTGSYAYDTDGYSDMHSYGLGQTRYEMLTQELEQNYYEIISSIKKYGGFYIGRYETGGLNGTAVVRKMDTNIAYQNWYTMYKKCLTLKGNNNNIKTSMITGNLWDETLEWLVQSGATISDGTTLTYSLVGSNSTTWGNYRNATFNYIEEGAEKPEETGTKEVSYNGTKIPAGSAEYTKANNIYDMAGNVWEWTTEANSTSSRVYRGGSDNDGGNNGPAAYRGSNIPSSRYYNVRVSFSTLDKIVVS